MLVRMAALAILSAAPASWLTNIAVGGKASLALKQIRGTLICDRARDRDCTHGISSGKVFARAEARAE